MPLAIRFSWSLLALGMCILLLAPGMSAAATIRVPADAPTIQAGINLAQSGDDVLVAPGVYYEHGITLKGGVAIRSEQGPEVTVVDAQRLGRGFSGVDLTEMVTVEGFTIRNGLTTNRGGGIRIVGTPGVVRNCAIENCDADLGGGIYTEGVSMEITGCRISSCRAQSEGGGIMALVLDSGQTVITGCLINGNQAYYGGAGIVAGGFTGSLRIIGCSVTENISRDGFGGAGISCRVPWLEIRDCLVTRNDHWAFGAAGIGISDSNGEIVSCTVSDNTGPLSWSYGVELENSTISILETIISFNQCGGIRCSQGTSLRCTTVFGNGGNDNLCGQNLGGNFSADPLFCDAANGDYTLDWASPCLPGNHPDGVDCGLIGALGAGCGTPPVTGACCLPDESCLVEEIEDCEAQGGSYMGDGTDCEPNPCIPTATEISTWGRIRHGYR